MADSFLFYGKGEKKFYSPQPTNPPKVGGGTLKLAKTRKGGFFLRLTRGSKKKKTPQGTFSKGEKRKEKKKTP